MAKPEEEMTVEPLELHNRRNEISINGLVTDTDIRKVGDNAGSMFVRIPRKLIGKIINVLDTPLDQEVSLEPLIEILSVYSPTHGWYAILRRPDRRRKKK